MAVTYGRSGVAGGAHTGGSTYGSYKAQPRDPRQFLDPSQRGRYEGALGAIESGGLNPRQTAKFERRLRKGKTGKAFKVARGGFGRMQEAERDIGLLRDVAASRALGAVHTQASQLSKPWKMQMGTSPLLTSEPAQEFAPAGLFEGVQPGGKLGRRLRTQYQEGVGTQAQQNIAGLVRGSGTYGTLGAESYTGAGSYGEAVAKKREISENPYASYLEKQRRRKDTRYG